MPQDWERALAVVAHPDDLEYGAAAAVAHWTDQGKDVRYLLATRGEAGIDDLEPGQSARVRVAEQQASAAVVGVSEVEFLDHRDGVIEEGIALRRDLAGAIRRHRPELVVMLTHTDTWGPGYWNSADHRAVGRCTLDAAMDAGNRWIFPEQLAEQGLRPWNGVRWVAAAGAPDPTHVQEVTDRDVERAVASLAEHRAYLSALSDEEPAEYARTFLNGVLEGMAEQTGGRQALGFRLYPR
ncbi:PIG-L deacetylase family protein [Streptomyces alkaliterrae]|uniref:PIG-L family deacetylase n=1 Tax=Streptomyces alkaliterrae TaxID=2213162 RepID=A0A5P0YNX6_9ACTN|nr:PIG-L deacetylase family protein [Streptomyces alkaliterrae]MBB1254911.1 PIG-L family deacetylase [Streptomyces alkaliterrae]MBB1259157.1 PIG-L family deacetylase [Streptomyces alkaliterrae]MQS02064.1 PIG-L family deacetylase [Streptomyces alkaliterrae]